MDGNNQNWGKKAAGIGKFAIAFFLFIIMLIWIYYKNGNFLN